jgi:hypothetical protein
MVASVWRRKSKSRPIYFWDGLFFLTRRADKGYQAADLGVESLYISKVQFDKGANGSGANGI